MPTKRLVLVVAALSLVSVAFELVAADKKSTSTQTNEHKRALQALQRLAFGPRPGEVDRVAAMGVDKWIDLQLHPDRIDDKALEPRLAAFRTIHMDTREMLESFPPPQLIKAVMEGKRPMPSDPLKRAVYQAQIERIQEKNDRKQDAAAANSAPPAGSTTAEIASQDGNSNDNPPATAPSNTGKGKLTEEQLAQRREDRLYADLKAQELLDKPPDERMKEVLQMSPEEQRALSTSLKRQPIDEFTEGMNPKQKETLQALSAPQQVVGDELMQAKLLRAIYSDRQLEEVMTDFWFNHFNVFIGKGADRYLITSYERDVIRPHAMGKFEDLLVATAKSPAMLFYLDNWLSVGPNSDVARGVPKNRPYYAAHRRRFPPNARPVKGKGKRSGGLNENYGRELMELHTLGVNGGYTQADVTELARVLTGWTIDQPQKGGGFKFEERMHEPGTKIVLGHNIKEHGQKEGMEVLRILARHPSTGRFICTKLAMRFVSDDPPAALVDRMAETFRKKDGEIREVLKTMLSSPEFWSDDAYRAKMKTPLEFVVSAVRATGTDVSDALPLARRLNTLGMPLYGMQPPTGYSMKSEAWVNSSALLGRMNFSVAMMSGKIKGVQINSERLLGGGSPDSGQVLAKLESSLLAGEVSRQTHDAITKQLENPQPGPRNLDNTAAASNAGMISGLILGSPEFQKR
jgi:uncharacterized protein (DUF1800 family)